jgi:HlyD family secretion protein
VNSHERSEAARPEGLPPAAGGLDAILAIGQQARSGLLGRRNLLWAAIAAAAAIGGLALWSLGGGGGGIRYVSEPAARGALTVIVTATGSAQPITQVNISSELSGTVRRVLVDYNSLVKQGEALAELDTDKLLATIESVRAKLVAAKARVAETAATIVEKRGDFERSKALAARQMASIKDFDIAKAAFDRAVAAHASALAEVTVNESELRLNGINLAKARILAPIDGVVLKRSVDPGQIVASSLQAPVLFVIAEDLRRMEVQVDIDEADVGKVKVGQNATFGVDAYPDRRFPAVIRDIRYGSEIIQGVVTYKAVLTIDNAELLIRPGMTATAEIVARTVQDALLVPNAALRFAPPAAQGGRPSPSFLQTLLPRSPATAFRPPSKKDDAGPSRTVWVLRDGAPAAVPVVVGATDGRKTEIVRGELAADQPVIVDAIVPKR